MAAPGVTPETDLWPSLKRAEQAMNEFGVLTDNRTIRFQRMLPGPIERVWAFLTESDKRGRWLAAGPMELRVGGKVELNFNNAGLSPDPDAIPDKYRGAGCATIEGRVTACEPPRLLSYTWGDGSGTGTGSEVSFELSPRGDDVLLVLTHRRLTTMLKVASGWHAHLGVLIDQLNDREPQPFWATYEKLEVAYQERLPIG
jgi:uncharacterized protein YndB with AHSA1/START domain